MAADAQTPAQIAARLSETARHLLLSWDHDPDAFVAGWDELEAAGLIGDTTGYPKLSPSGLAVRAEVEKEAGR